MKFLADMGVSMTTVATLRNLGHDAIHLREQGLMRLEDSAIVAKARAEERAVLTFDLDFGEIMARSGSVKSNSDPVSFEKPDSPLGNAAAC